ncbi:MAG: hypothetical protein MUF49_04590 [Oculatellaceae cyanobacterium Prado106]|jgi:hypothetical protein|nr:hypothetical protein [Oculatellaceae cyanobacterium Prado106]
MTDSIKATRATVTLGSIPIDGFMLPDGSYRMSQTQAAEAVGLPRRNLSDFLRSNALQSLLGKGYTGTISEREEIEIESEVGKRGQSRFLSMPLEIVSVYWLWQAHRGNKQALALCVALMTETLERRFDRAFGLSRSEDEWDKRLTDNILTQFDTTLSMAFEAADIASSREKLLEQQLRDLGVEPWALPSPESD